MSIRTWLKPGDLGYIIHLHGKIYNQEYQYGLQFEKYVTEGLLEFYHQYDPATNRVWIAEHNNTIVGFMLLMKRGDTAQLRYFLIEKPYRSIGLGTKMMNLYMAFLRECNYPSSYLLTTNDLPAAAHLYKKFGFELTEEHPSNDFGKPLMFQRYDLRR